MAENSLSQAVSDINDNSTMEIGLTAEGQPAARSDIVAHHFKRNHKDVLRDIRKLRAKCPESFYRRNFAPIEIDTHLPHSGGIRKDRAYLLTRDGFALLVMGFTGADAVRWKIRYIEAFNVLEAAALESHADLAREAGYQQGLDAGRAAAAPLVQAERQQAAARVWSLGPAKKRRLRSAVRYRNMGLGIAGIAKLLDVSRREVSLLLKAAQDLGLLPQGKPASLQQASLPGVTL